VRLAAAAQVVGCGPGGLSCAEQCALRGLKGARRGAARRGGRAR
jgi:thioredoxin reductase